MRFSVIRKAKYMKDKRILNGWMAYVFHECEDGIIMSDSQGLVTSAGDIKELCEGLLKFIGKHSEDIEEYNLKRNAEIERDMRGYSERSSKRKGTRKKGYVYLLECGGRYKIGFSKDVERRISQLDTRPFKLNLIAKSKLISDAYDREQEIHEYFANSRIEGEWYCFSDDEALYAEEIIKELGEDC